jgi:hypothetical protein
MSSKPCPHCGQSATIMGSTCPTDSTPEFFRPLLRRNLRYWLHHFNCRTGVEITDSFRACLSCGLVWGFVPAGELTKFIAREQVRREGGLGSDLVSSS